MKRMAISKFKAQCLGVLERVRKTGQPVLVTRWGKPVAQVAPAPLPEAKGKSTFGCLAGSVEELGDILEPLPTEDWEVLR